MPARLSDDAREAKYVRQGPGCWTWTGAVTPDGYAIFTANYTNEYAHRWMYQRHVGPIPDGFTIDHRCHDPKVCSGGKSCPHRACVNPAHLRPVTRGDNVRRSSRW